METVNPGEQPFSTSEAVLAYSLYLAGCEFIDDRQPCSNLFDAEILAKLGYRGEKLGEAAEAAWRDEKKGHVQYHFKLTPRAADLIRAYREQAAELEKADGKASEFVMKILRHYGSGAILEDEALCRLGCVMLKTRIEFVNIWKKMVPLLRVPVEGKARTFETTATKLDEKGQSRVVDATGVQRPGFQIMSLNLSPEKRKKMGLK